MGEESQRKPMKHSNNEVRRLYERPGGRAQYYDQAGGCDGAPMPSYMSKDEDCKGGGEPGAMAANPGPIEGVVGRVWQKGY